jgi:quercetin dioxygenase-like cupin family protein
MAKQTITHWPVPPADWPEHLRQDFSDGVGRGQVGSRLVSETERVRVWSLTLKPGERIGFHTHVLDYFWTAVTGGKARSRYADGRTLEVSYEPGDTKHHTFPAGEFMVHDLENIGGTELSFTTVEFLDSANAPLTVQGEAGGSAVGPQST